LNFTEEANVISYMLMYILNQLIGHFTAKMNCYNVKVNWCKKLFKWNWL